MNSRVRLTIWVVCGVLVLGFALGLAVFERRGETALSTNEMLRLYFATPDGSYLVDELRLVPAGISPKEVLELLIQGPLPGSYLVRTIPVGTRVNSVKINDTTAVVDLDKSILKVHSGGSTGELMTVYSIVNTLTSFPGIERVRILIDGENVETLAGHVDLSAPLGFDKTLLFATPDGIEDECPPLP